MAETTNNGSGGVPTGERRGHHRGVRIVVVAIACAVVFLAWGAVQLLSNDIHRRAEAILDASATHLVEVIDSRLVSSTNVAQAARAFVYSSVEVTAEEWIRFGESIDVRRSLPGFSGIVLIEKAPGTDIYTVKYSADGDVAPNIVGMNLYAEDAFRPMIERSRDEGEYLSSETPAWAKEPFALSFLPLYEGKVTPTTVGERRARIIGLVATVHALRPAFYSLATSFDEALFVPGLRVTAGSSSVANDAYAVFIEGRIGYRRTLDLQFGQRVITAELIAPPGFGASRLAVQLWWIVALLILASGAGFIVFLRYLESERDRIGRAVTKATEQLREQEWQLRNSLEDAQKFRQAVEQSADQIIITDSDGTILYANEAIKDITGFTTQEVLGKKAGAKELWGGHMTPEFYKRMWHTIKDEQLPFHGEITNRRKNGEMYDAETTISPIVDASGAVRYFISTERDMTHEREIERLQNEFVSIASHQLRTPLGGIRWVAERLMKTEKFSEEGFQYLQDILSSARNLADLVDLLLNVSRIEQEGGPSARPESLELVSFIEGVLAELSVVADKKGVTLNFGPPADDVMMETDRAALRNIVQTFVSNAIEYTPAGGRVVVRVDARDSVVRIAVRDTGIGIPPAEYVNLFHKFFRGEKARNVKPGGTGLGLYLAKKAAELLKGTVWFESELGQGSTFFAELPRRTPARVGGKPLA